MALNQQQELFFEQLGRCTTAEAANQKQSSLLKSPSKSEKHSGKGFDGKKGGKNEDNEDDDAVSVIKLFSKQKFLSSKAYIWRTFKKVKMLYLTIFYN